MLLKQKWFLLAKKDSQTEGFLANLLDFHQNMISGNAAIERQENFVVNEGTNHRDFTVGISRNKKATNESMVNVETLEKCFTERINREVGNIVDTEEDRIQNALLTAIDNIIAPKIELVIRSISASSGRDETSVTANSERGEHLGLNASLETHRETAKFNMYQM